MLRVLILERGLEFIYALSITLRFIVTGIIFILFYVLKSLNAFLIVTHDLSTFDFIMVLWRDI